MEYNDFGKTGEKISAVSFGTLGIGGNEFGNCYGPTDDQISLRAIEAAIELGCNCFDTADFFGMGKSLSLLGKGLKGKRANILIAFKVGIDIHRAGVFPSYSESHYSESIDKALSELNTDYIDIVNVLNPPVSMLDGAAFLDPLLKMKDQGKIRFLGLSAFLPQESAAARKIDSVDCLMLRFNLAARETGPEIFAGVESGRAVLVREPLAGGLLTGKYRADATFEPGDNRAHLPFERYRTLVQLGDRVKQIAVDAGCSPSALLTRWTLDRTRATSVVVGIKTKQQAEENFVDIPVDEDLFRELDQLTG